MVLNKGTINDIFSSLTLSERFTLLSEKGKYIGVRFYYNYYINLYLLDENFYELYYFIPDNLIEKIEPLDEIKKLDLYIKYMHELKKG